MMAILYRTCLLVMVKKRFIKILVVIFILCATFMSMKRSLDEDVIVNYKQFYDRDIDFPIDFNSHEDIVASYYKKRKHWKTSNLGTILFKNIGTEAFDKNSAVNKTFLIVVWKYWKWLENRHVRNFGSRNDPLDECSVKNCRFTPYDKDLETADAVLIHMQRGIIPTVKKRNITQKWVFLTDESPENTFSLIQKKPSLVEFANIFNWTMTYRSDADVPVPYGRTVPRSAPVMATMSNVTQSLARLVPNWKEKQHDIPATILMSNCGVTYRMSYLNELKEHVAVDVHGRCSTDHKDSCPGGFKSDCKVISKYLFYLVFENAMCLQYITEKSFYNAYTKGAIPVILGPTLKDCELLLPPNSFLHVENYETPADLAKQILYISKSAERLLSYHRWRNHFKVVNEHGYFGTKSFHYCRLCEALNYNDDEPYVYDEDSLGLFFDPNVTCAPHSASEAIEGPQVSVVTGPLDDPGMLEGGTVV